MHRSDATDQNNLGLKLGNVTSDMEVNENQYKNGQG